MEAQKDMLSADTLAAIKWLGMPEGTPFPLAKINPSPRPETMAQVELLPAEVRAWDDAMLLWTRACCCFHDGCWGSAGSLYVSHIEWAHQTGQPFVADRETFTSILMALGFQIQDGMVYGLILAEDWEASFDARFPRKSPQFSHGREVSK
ncbi:MAG: hypothetical protein ACYCO5_10310 [Acidobacteriaceae bacterium]